MSTTSQLHKKVAMYSNHLNTIPKTFATDIQDAKNGDCRRSTILVGWE
jgi:hypothetical protein